ncbi:unnamed protein product [Trifolium pratense]|uniref:Uncharacterized protein n=1 Tax=Trifolium pratense TaxID=57577 RepID=A0ACB0LUZ6_TRIPR|nr:unnamed protein product [Trifolium pratense]
MEEIISKDERDIALKEVHFCKLEKIILKNMDNLKTIWHHQFETLKMLQVNKCSKIVVVFPSSMQKSYNKLEMLEVTDCGLVEEIFELIRFKESSSIEEDTTTHLKEISIDELPKLKKIWSVDPQGILSFQNLMNVQVNSCASLEYLLPLSVAIHCSLLSKLYIKYCGNMKEIVAEEKESSVNATPIFEFNQLSTLILLKLVRLKGFFAKNHTLACPSLKKIDVYSCPKLILYRTLSTRSSNIRDDKVSVSTHQPLFIVEEVIPNLEELKIDGEEANMILQVQNSSGLFTKITYLELCYFRNDDTVLFHHSLLENVPNLESLFVTQCYFKKLFQDEWRTHTQIKALSLNLLPNLEHICKGGSQIEFLQLLWVNNCSSLINLLPYSATFSHLVHMEIICCNGLKYLLTSPTTTQSLVKLSTLKIKECNSLEEIIVTGGEENIHITFISLKILMLECLPSLNRFGSSKCFFKFPLLEVVVVRECPRMNVFSEGYTSTPYLQKVQIAENDQQWFWRGNLNDTISNMFEDKVAFSMFKYLALSDYPELKDLWYGELDRNVFCNLKHLVVKKCDCLSHVLFPSNVMQVLYGLEELEVTDCDSLEAVFDVEGMKSKDTLVKKQSTQLKKLTLSSLPKLKHIWNEDPHEIINFGNLCTLKVSTCQSLSYIFSLPLCEDLQHLEMLEIELCEIEQIVAMEEGSMLIYLALSDYPEMKDLWYGQVDQNLFCNLKHLVVNKCDFLSHVLFPSNVMQVLYGLEELEVTDCDSLEAVFDVEGIKSKDTLVKKQSTQLKKLTLSSLPKLKHIWNEDPHEIINFGNLCTLKVSTCQSLSYIFSLPLCEDLQHLEMLEIELCEIEQIVAMEEGSMVHSFNFPKLNELTLSCLTNLTSFYRGKHSLDCPSLKDLNVYGCDAFNHLDMFSIEKEVQRSNDTDQKE